MVAADGCVGYIGSVKTWTTAAVVLIAAGIVWTAPPADADELYVPVVAQVKGSNGAYWNTELWLSNTSNGPATYSLTFLPSTHNNRELLRGTSPVVSIPPGETVHLDDVAPPSKQGALRILTSGSVVVRCRLFNASASRALGQMIPALHRDDLIPPLSEGHLVPLVRSPRFRTNVGLFNPNLDEIRVHAYLLDGQGRPAGHEEIRLAPGSHRQINDMLLSFRVERGEGYRLVLTGDRDFAAYASMVDNRTGSPSFILPEVH